MSATFTTQLTFDWANQSSIAPAISTPGKKVPEAKTVEQAKKLVRKHEAAGMNVNLGVPVRAKPIEDIIASHRIQLDATNRRNRPEHISDLLLVVLDRYGISPDEFLATLKD